MGFERARKPMSLNVIGPRCLVVLLGGQGLRRPVGLADGGRKDLEVAPQFAHFPQNYRVIDGGMLGDQNCQPRKGHSYALVIRTATCSLFIT